MLGHLLKRARRSACGYALPLAILCACNDLDEQNAQALAGGSFPVSIIAHSEIRAPVTGVQISTGKEVLGKTDANGTARITLHGDEGDQVALNIKCPPQFASPDRPFLVGLRQLGNGKTSARFEIECFSLVHQLVVGVRAENGPNLPIFRLKKLVGRTDETGVAHVLLEASTNEQVALTLDTSDNQALLPENPTLDFVARDSDELVLVSQKFTVKPAPPRRATPRNIPRHL